MPLSFGSVLAVSTLLPVLLLLGQSAASAASCEGPTGSATTFGESIDYVGNRILKKGNTAISIDMSDRDPIYYRLKLRLVTPVSSVWRLLITQRDGKPLSALQESDFILDGQDSSKEVWTDRFHSSALKLVLDIANPNTTGVEVHIVDVVVMPEKTEGLFFSAKNPGAPDYSSLYSFNSGIEEETKKILRLGDRIGMLVGRGPRKDGKEVSWCCSGFFLTEDTMITNWHCGSASDSNQWKGELGNIMVDRNWVGDFKGNGPISKTGDHAEYRVARVLGVPNKELDYALIQLVATRENKLHTSYLPPFKIGSAVTAGDDLLVIHHAGCRPKAISQNCRVRDQVYKNWRDDIKKTDFSHDCDTEGGSSGAPVFNTQGQLVGIHHLGFENTSNGECDGRNKATQIQQILSDIQNNQSQEVKEFYKSIDVRP